MKRWYLKSEVMGEVEIQATSLVDAISKVQWEWANTGKRTLVERDYVVKNEKEITVKTDY